MPTEVKLKTTANAPAPKRGKQHPLLEWHVSDQGGILEVEPMGPDYANGSTLDHQVCFHSYADARRQLLHLISILIEQEYNLDPYHCTECGTVLPFEVTQTEDWDCPKCHTPNMGS